MTRQKISAKLRQRKKQLGYTLADIQTFTGLNQNSIHNVMAGTKNYTLDNLLKISKTLKLVLTMEEL